MRNKIEGRRRASALACLMVGVLAPASAMAYGIEVPENGGVAFGRAGAFVARASDPSAIMLNPGGLGNLRGFQLTLSTNLVQFDHCFQRTGSYDGVNDATALNVAGTRFEGPGMPGNMNGASAGDAYYTYGNVPYPRVCKDNAVGLALQLLATYRINNRFTLGFGVFSPSTQGSTQNFSDTVPVTANVGGMTRNFLAPSPARYLLFRKSLTVIYPTIAFGARITDWLSAGVSAHLGYASYNFGLHANADYNGPQSPSSDVFIGLSAQGLFPAFTVGFLATPHRMLSIGGNFRYNAPVQASGTATNRAQPYSDRPIESTFSVNELNASLPWQLRLGVRFALPRAGRPTQNDGSGQYDPMTDDVFDVEADFIYEATSMLSETSLRNTGNIITACGTMPPQPVPGTNAVRCPDGMPVSAPRSIAIRSALSDVMGVRVGGDYNVIPGRLALRAGFSFETAGASPNLAQIHLPSYAGVSVHGGVTFRWRWLDITAGYAHIFYFDNVAETGTRSITTPGNPAEPNPDNRVQLDPAVRNPPNNGGCSTGTCVDSMRGPGAYTINRGTYTASQNSFNIAFGLRF
jgi:long-subunit fatty acid transport protein